ncbi:MAG: ribonuclease III [Pseudomonadota bacterium]
MTNRSRRTAELPEALLRLLQYRFREPSLLACALTHRSRGSDNNERLEFLGDSVLNLVISSLLYDRFPELSEGDLTRLRASLVNKPSLAALARELALGQHLQLGEGELRSGGFDRDSILADALEAVFGAIYLDGGLDEVRRVIASRYHDSLERLDPRAVPKDPKTRLQEYLQKRSLPTPEYVVTQVSGDGHNQRFVVECRIDALDDLVRGEGNSRRIAEQQAAALALERLHDR